MFESNVSNVSNHSGTSICDSFGMDDYTTLLLTFFNEHWKQTVAGKTLCHIYIRSRRLLGQCGVAPLVKDG